MNLKFNILILISSLCFCNSCRIINSKSSFENKHISEEYMLPLPKPIINYYHNEQYEQYKSFLYILKEIKKNPEQLDKYIKYWERLVKNTEKSPNEIPTKEWEKIINLLNSNPNNKLYFYSKKQGINDSLKHEHKLMILDNGKVIYDFRMSYFSIE